MSKLPFLHPHAVTPWSQESISTKMLPGVGQAVSTANSAAYPSANLAIYVPFFVQSPFVVARFMVWNGVTISGNIDLGVYDMHGRQIAHTDQAQTNDPDGLTFYDVADFTLYPGLFFLAIAMDNTTATLNAVNIGSVSHATAAGVMTEAAAYPLPTLATFAKPTTDFVPFFGITPRGTP